MRVYMVSVGQSFPEFITEEFGVLAEDLTESLVLGMEVTGTLKEDLIKMGVPKQKIANLRITGINEEEVIVNPERRLDKEKVNELVNMVRTSID